MTPKEKKEFVEKVVEGCKRAVLCELEKTPERWEGVELRWYIRDIFDAQLVFGQFRDKRSGRYRNYHNDLVVNGL